MKGLFCILCVGLLVLSLGSAASAAGCDCSGGACAVRTKTITVEATAIVEKPRDAKGRYVKAPAACAPVKACAAVAELASIERRKPVRNTLKAVAEVKPVRRLLGRRCHCE